MYFIAKAGGNPERVIDGFLSVAQLLAESRLTRLYTFILRNEAVTIDEIVDELETPEQPPIRLQRHS